MARRFFGGRKIRGLKTDTKPTAPETDTEFEETDTGNKYTFDGSNWKFAGDGKLTSSETKPTQAETNATITETDTDNTYKYDGTNWNFTGDGRMASGTTKPVNAVTGSTILETDTLATFDYNGSAWAERVASGGNPAGTIINFTGLIAQFPTGYLRCDGTAVSRTTYSDLFTAIGTEWGVGDGSTTFNVPDFETGNQFLRSASADGDIALAGGEATHQLTVAELASHSHSYTKPQTGYSGGGSTYGRIVGSTTGSAGGDQPHNNEPQYKGVFRLIKI